MLRSKGRLLWLAVVTWVPIAFLFAIQATARGVTGPFPRVLLGSLMSFLPCILFTPPIVLLSERFTFASDRRTQSIAAHVIGALTFVIVGGAAMGWSEWTLPWLRHTDFLNAGLESISRYVAVNVLSYVLIAAGATALVYARESQEQALTTARLSAQLAEAKLTALTAQLRPHFLFNSLNAISALVREDPPHAERLLARLSELLRHSLREDVSGDASLESELDFLQKYVDLQEARFAPRLKVVFEIDQAALDARLPRLLLLPLVENAIRHGVAPRPGAGLVTVVASRVNGSVSLSVSDDGLGLGAPKTTEGIGLRATRERLRQMFGEDHSFLIGARAGGGTTCSITVPYRA